MRSDLAKEAIHTTLLYYQALQRLGNYRALAEFYRDMAQSFLSLLELYEDVTQSRANLGLGEERFFPLQKACEAEITASEACERLRAMMPLAEQELPEDELARLLKALREDGFKWQPPRAV